MSQKVNDNLEGTESRILQSAATLFAVRGYYGTGIRAIADGAGVKLSTLYHYMESKDQLLEAIMAQGFAALIDSAKRALATGAGPAEHLVHLAQGHVAVSAKNRVTLSVLVSESRVLTPEARGKVLSMRDEYQGIWQSVLATGNAEGIFSIQNVAITRLALLEMCTGVGTWFSADGPLSIFEICQHHAELCLASVNAKNPDGTPIHVADMPQAVKDSVSAVVNLQTEPAAPIFGRLRKEPAYDS